MLRPPAFQIHFSSKLQMYLPLCLALEDIVENPHSIACLANMPGMAKSDLESALWLFGSNTSHSLIPKVIRHATACGCHWPPLPFKKAEDGMFPSHHLPTRQTLYWTHLPCVFVLQLLSRRIDSAFFRRRPYFGTLVDCG